MVTADSFVTELEAKNDHSFKGLLARYLDGVAKENFTPADLLRLEVKAVVEATEVAALWLVENDSLSAKIELGEQCGDGARHFRIIGGRLTALGVDVASFDPRAGGYTKLFAFFRSLQTPEERSSAGPITLRVMTSIMPLKLLS
jgi:hypothetical protein